MGSEETFHVWWGGIMVAYTLLGAIFMGVDFLFYSMPVLIFWIVVYFVGNIFIDTREEVY